MKAPWQFFLLWLSLAVLAACDDHEHQQGDQRGQAGGHDHSDEHLAGHDHHEAGHGHDGAVQRVTKWSDKFELFLEHAPAVKGKKLSWLVHLTWLADFSSVDDGRVRLTLDGPAKLTATAAKPLRPGIFQLEVSPPKAGSYQGRLEISGSKSGNIDGLELVVSATEQEAAAKVQEEPHAGLIELLKEQQWKVPFATAFASTGELVESIQVAGTVDTPPGGSAVVGAPVSGRLIAPARGLPRPGDTVTKGTLLASLAPAPSSPEGAARATLAVAEAHARVGAAKAALERAKRLIAEEAISQRELEDREREQGLAEEAVKAAKHAQALFSGAQAGGSAGAWRLSAPIAGTLSEVRATPGASVSPQDVLFRIVDTSELWIRARVPEQDATKLRKDKSAAYQLLGLDVWHPIQLGSETGDSLVSVSKTVDPVARTVDIIYRLSKPSAELRVGGLVQVSLPVGSDFKGIVIPRTAVVDDAGKSVVYVQLDGEHFEERLIRLGPQSGATLGVVSGLKAKERVVTRGAHLVRLAERAANSPTPHGHIH